MNTDHNRRLETEIDRELKALPELAAPETLAARVMARIEKPIALPWYRQPWQQWPTPARAFSFGVMLALFGGLCFAIWFLFQAPGTALAVQKAEGSLSSLSVIWNTLGALANAVMLAIKKLGTGFLIACISMAVFSYLACIGLGTAVTRFAFSHVRRNQL